jgi:hypothetical protein
MSATSDHNLFDDNDDATSIVSTGTFVYEDPWAAAEAEGDDNTGYTDKEGTIRVKERVVSGIPVLSSSDKIEVGGKKNYGLRVVLPTRVGRVDSTYEPNKPDKSLFSQRTLFRLPFPLRPHNPPGEERDILLNNGSSWDIDVIAPAFAPDATDESTWPYTWIFEGCFHPNWVVWKRRVSDDSFRISAGQMRWSTAVAQFFFPVDKGIQMFVISPCLLCTGRSLTC